MKKVLIAVFAALLVVGLVSSEAQAQKAQPDLMVTKASITKDASGRFVQSITVTITNNSAVRRLTLRIF